MEKKNPSMWFWTEPLMSWVSKQSRQVSVTFLFLLATFCFGVMRGKILEVMLVLGAYSVYSAALEWQTSELLTNSRKYWFLLKLLVMWVEGWILTGGSKLRTPICPVIRELKSDLQTVLYSEGLVWQVFLFSRLGLAYLIRRSPIPSFGCAEILDTQLKASGFLLGRKL